MKNRNTFDEDRPLTVAEEDSRAEMGINDGKKDLNKKIGVLVILIFVTAIAAIIVEWII